MIIGGIITIIFLTIVLIIGLKMLRIGLHFISEKWIWSLLIISIIGILIGLFIVSGKYLELIEWIKNLIRDKIKWEWLYNILRDIYRVIIK